MPKIGSHFVGQKINKVSRVSPTIQYLNQAFDNEEQLINIDKVSAGNSGHPKTPDTWYISAMDESFGLKL